MTADSNGSPLAPASATARPTEAERDALLAALKQTPHTDVEIDVIDRYWTGEATADDLASALRSRFERAVAKVGNTGVPTTQDKPPVCRCWKHGSHFYGQASCPRHRDIPPATTKDGGRG